MTLKNLDIYLICDPCLQSISSPGPADQYEPLVCQAAWPHWPHTGLQGQQGGLRPPTSSLGAPSGFCG